MLTKFGVPVLIFLHEAAEVAVDMLTDLEHYLAEWRRVLEV